MTERCIKCRGPVADRFRLAWDRNHFVRLCDRCSRQLEALVAEYGDIGPISLDNRRFTCWLEENRFMTLEEFLGIQGPG